MCRSRAAGSAAVASTDATASAGRGVQRSPAQPSVTRARSPTMATVAGFDLAVIGRYATALFLWVLDLLDRYSRSLVWDRYT